MPPQVRGGGGFPLPAALWKFSFFPAEPGQQRGLTDTTVGTLLPPPEPLPNPSHDPQVPPKRLSQPPSSAYDGADPFSSLGDFGKGIVD